MSESYRCTNVVFDFDSEITHITFRADLELNMSGIWTKVTDLLHEVIINGPDEFRSEILGYVRGMLRQDHERRTTLAQAKTQLEGAIFTVD